MRERVAGEMTIDRGRGLATAMVKELQIHYIYKGLELKSDRRRGLEMGLIGFEDGTTPRGDKQTSGIQCMHTLKKHEKSMQIRGGRRTWGTGEPRD